MLQERNELSGPFQYADIPNMKTKPGDFSSFQPTLDKNVFLLTTSNMVTPVTFQNHTIQIAEKRQIIIENDENLWGAKEISNGLTAVGYKDKAEVSIYSDAKVINTFAMPNVESFGFLLLPDWDPVWSDKPSSAKPSFLSIDAHKVVLIDLAEKEHNV